MIKLVRSASDFVVSSSQSQKGGGFAVAKFLQDVIKQSCLKSQFGSNPAVEACVESVVKSAMDRQQGRQGLEQQDINKLCVVKKAEMTAQTGSRCPSVLGRKSHNQSRTASSQSVQYDNQVHMGTGTGHVVMSEP